MYNKSNRLKWFWLENFIWCIWPIIWTLMNSYLLYVFYQFNSFHSIIMLEQLKWGEKEKPLSIMLLLFSWNELIFILLSLSPDLFFHFILKHIKTFNVMNVIKHKITLIHINNQWIKTSRYGIMNYQMWFIINGIELKGFSISVNLWAVVAVI